MTAPDRATQQRWWTGVVEYVQTVIGREWAGATGVLNEAVTLYAPLEPCESCGRLVLAMAQPVVDDGAVRVLELGDTLATDVDGNEVVRITEHTPSVCQRQRARR